MKTREVNEIGCTYVKSVDLDPSASVVSNGNSIYETAFDMKRFTVFHMGVDSYHSKGI